ncbi:response regulator [Bacteriovoracaceae bacterium]|nr:response regulator [Bacteriovoracaceae bacterium]
MLPLSYRILLVEDFLSLMTVQTGILGDLGYDKIETAVNGIDAWNKLEELFETNNKIECIVSDWNMPEMDGFELLKKVKADSRFKDLPFYMLTSETDKKDILRAIENGVTNYIVKPATFEVLQEKFKRFKVE